MHSTTVQYDFILQDFSVMRSLAEVNGNMIDPPGYGKQPDQHFVEILFWHMTASSESKSVIKHEITIFQ